MCGVTLCECAVCVRERDACMLVRTGRIHIIVVRKEGDISVDHWYKWALKMVERYMQGVNTRLTQMGKVAL